MLQITGPFRPQAQTIAAPGGVKENKSRDAASAIEIYTSADGNTWGRKHRIQGDESAGLSSPGLAMDAGNVYLAY